LTVLADRGYFKGQQIYDCEQAGIKTLVPKPQTSGNKAAGLFDKADFRYIPAKDEYQCPAGQRAIWRYTRVEDGLTLHKYWSSACPRCPIKSICTIGDYRRIARWEHENVLDAEAPEPHTPGIAETPSDRRAPLRHDQSLDGSDALPDQDDPAREYRNEFAHPCVQPETRDAGCRNRPAHEGNAGLNSLHCRMQNAKQ